MAHIVDAQPYFMQAQIQQSEKFSLHSLAAPPPIAARSGPYPMDIKPCG
jgi:hypothetical protein